MHPLLDAKLLLLVLAANGAPIIGKDIFRRDHSFPLDGGCNLRR